MPTVRAVKNPEADPKTGRPRPKSGVAFPYYDLDTSIEIAKTIHERAGGVCDLSQLATILGYSGVKNGAFRTRVSAAKMFGLIEEADQGKVRVSRRGLTIVAPVSEPVAARARVDAFMAVELFSKVFERFNGVALPEAVGLKNLLATEYQVVTDRIPATVRILLDSAEQAGFFQIAGNRSRMARPLVGAPAAAPPPPPKHEAPPPPRSGGGSGGGGDGSATSNIDPAILGLLQRLPPGGTPLSAKRRQALIDAFTATVGFIYPDADGEEKANDQQ